MALKNTDFDQIHDKLCAARDRKRTLQLARLQEQINAENLAYEAYCDGVYDALREVKNLPEKGGRSDGIAST